MREQHLTARRIRNLGLQKNRWSIRGYAFSSNVSLLQNVNWIGKGLLDIFGVSFCVQFGSTSSWLIPKHYTKTPLHRLQDSELQSKPPSLKISPRRVFPHRRTGTTITLCQRSQKDEGIQFRRTTLYVKIIMVKSEEWDMIMGLLFFYYLIRSTQLALKKIAMPSWEKPSSVLVKARNVKKLTSDIDTWNIDPFPMLEVNLPQWHALFLQASAPPPPGKFSSGNALEEDLRWHQGSVEV